MPTSSLIFVVIVAIWAAYLVQHWLRRREDAAHRSVDEFSDGMRVLDKRPVHPGVEAEVSRRGSVVRRRRRVEAAATQAVPAPRGGSPLVARRSESQLAHDRVELEERVEVDVLDAEGAAGSAPPARVPSGQRRLRAVVLVASVLWVPVSVVLAATGVLMWVSVALALLTVVAVLFWLRTEARADRVRAARFRSAAARRVRQVREVRQVRRTRSRVAVAPVLSAEDTQVIQASGRVGAAAPTAAESVAGGEVAEATGAPLAVEAVEGAAPAADLVFDLEAVAAEAVLVAEPVDEAVPESEVPGSWSPVPVPKPTYALKAKAEPRYTEGGIPADVFDTPEFADEAQELDDRALFARRAASQ